MLRYVIKRIGIGLVTLLALIVVTFLLVQPVEKLARTICNDPAPEMPPAQQ